MLKLSNFDVQTKDGSKTILQNINLEFETGKIYVISGQNGSGKSTLAQVIIGNPEYQSNAQSKIEFENIDIYNFTPDQRSRFGIFVSMQYPVEVPGVSLLTYLKLIIQLNREGRGLEKLTAKQTLDLIHSKIEIIGWHKDILKRNLNEGMSGGERKKSEILQMLLLDLKLIILDEIDSGLDKQALETIIRVIQNFMTKDKTLIVITHQQKILELLKPNEIVYLKNGSIVL